MQTTRSLPLALALASLLPSARARADVRLETSPVVGSDPVGIAGCEADTRFSFAGLSERAEDASASLDLWWSDDGTSCLEASARASGACTHVEVVAGAFVAGDAGTATLVTSVGALFEDLPTPCEGTIATRALYFLDTPTSDVATTFTEAQAVSTSIALDTIPPSAVTIDGDAVGDVSISIGWLGVGEVPPTEARFYLDPNGCAHDAPPTSYTLVAGGAPPSSARVTAIDDAAQLSGTTAFATSVFGWSTARYAETGVLAMTTVDEAGNESPLSNLVCVYHARCLDDGGDHSGCGPTGLCTVAAPGSGRSGGLGLALGLAALVRIARRRRRLG